MRRAFIGVGSNIAPDLNIREALHRLARCARITAISTFYRQPAVGRPDQPDFVNGVVAIEVGRSLNLVKELRRIEEELGRQRSADRFAPRPIDLDLLLAYGDVAQDGALPLPHTDILNRAFVAIPLSELAPPLVLPGYGISIADIAARFSPHTMQSLPEYTCRLRHELLPENRSFC